MNKRALRVAGVCLALMGVLLLLRAPAWAAKSATWWLIHEMGGSVDTNKYVSVLQTYGLSYSLLGGICLTVGLIRLLWTTESKLPS